MMKKFLILTGAIALSTAFALAQGPGAPPDPATQAQNQVNRLATLLSLTDAQKAAAIAIYTNAGTAAQTLQSSSQINRQSMQDAIKSNSTALIDQLATQSGALQGQVTAINAKAEAAFYAILTTDQKTKYDAMPPGGGRGGPGGPPPGMGPNGRFGRGIR